jgi:hypothetical protein
MSDNNKVTRKSARPMGYIFPKRIQSILQGDTPVTTVGYETNKDSTTRNAGDEWTDEKGVRWRQHNGWRERVSGMEEIRTEIKKILDTPKNCPTCGEAMKTDKLDVKFWKLRGKCFNCVIKEETHYRSTGQYLVYEQNIMLNNALSYYKDIRNQMQHYVDSIPDTISYVEEDGQIENWDNNNKQTTIEFFRNELKELDEVITKIEEELTKWAPVTENTDGK